MTEQPKTEQILAKHLFSDSEIRGIAIKMAEVSQEYTDTESEFASVKADYSAKLKKLDLERDTLVQRIRDGFEMRPATAYVRLDYPEKGRKTYYRNFEIDEFLGMIREEAMSAADQQRELPLADPNDKFAEQAAELKAEGLAEQAQDQPSERHAEIGDSEREFEQTKDVISTAAQPIGTSLEQKLTEAAAGKALPMVQVDFPPDFAPAKYTALFSKAAKRQGWPEACIKVLCDVCNATADSETTVEAGKRVQDVLRAHSEPVPIKGAVRTHGDLASLPPIKMHINSITLDSQERFFTEFQRAANEAGWPETALETVGNIIREEPTVSGMHEAVKGYLAK